MSQVMCDEWLKFELNMVINMDNITNYIVQ